MKIKGILAHWDGKKVNLLVVTTWQKESEKGPKVLFS
jgi:hypothetical protein